MREGATVYHVSPSGTKTRVGKVTVVFKRTWRATPRSRPDGVQSIETDVPFALDKYVSVLRLAWRGDRWCNMFDKSCRYAIDEE